MKEFRAADAGERQEKMGMEKICVYADFDFLKEKEQIGTLFGEQVRGSRHFSFEFATGWLEDHGSVILGGDMQNEAGRQYPPEGEQLFSFIRDTFPDRWGRMLFRFRLRQSDSSVKNGQSGMDGNFLFTDEFSRMGGILWRDGTDGDFIGRQAKCPVPSVTGLSALAAASMGVEAANEKNAVPSRHMLDLLALSACSLGGARPKASVIDTEGLLCVAKFASVKDKEDTELLEHFAHLMPKKPGSALLRPEPSPWKETAMRCFRGVLTGHPTESASILPHQWLFWVSGTAMALKPGRDILTLLTLLP